MIIHKKRNVNSIEKYNKYKFSIIVKCILNGNHPFINNYNIAFHVVMQNEEAIYVSEKY